MRAVDTTHLVTDWRKYRRGRGLFAPYGGELLMSTYEHDAVCWRCDAVYDLLLRDGRFICNGPCGRNWLWTT